MIPTKKLVRMGKWQKITARGWKGISSARTNKRMAAANDSKKPSVVGKGCFVIYTMDDKRFLIPLGFLSSSVFRELFKMPEEEFGLPSDGPITLPCDSVVMNYIVSLVKRGLAKDLEKIVLNSLNSYHCSSHSNTFFHEGHADQTSLVSSF